jgi:TRAP-type C4-dicarboxylate transport system substrate-binding protein
VVQGAIRTAIDVQRKAAGDLEATLRTRLEAGGVEFVDLTEDERSAFITASAPAIARAHEGVPEELFDLARA